MSIAELFAELGTHRERIWLIIQFWSSVSFGLIIAVHIIQTRFHWFVTLLLISLYTVYTIFCMRFVQEANIIAGGFIQELNLRLSNLPSTTESLSEVQQAFELASYEFAGTTYAPFAIGGLFITVISYIIYRQLQIRRDAS